MNGKRKEFNFIISHRDLLNETVEENNYKFNNQNKENLFIKKTKEKINLNKMESTKMKKSEIDILNTLNKSTILKNKYKKIKHFLSNIIFRYIIALILSKINIFPKFHTLLSIVHYYQMIIVLP